MEYPDPSNRNREGAWRSLRGGPVVVFRWRNEAGWPVDFVTPNVLKMFGYSAEDLKAGKVSFASLVHPKDLERVALEVTKAQALGLDNFEQAYHFVRADGEVRHLYDYTVVLRNEQGEAPTLKAMYSMTLSVSRPSSRCAMKNSTRATWCRSLKSLQVI